MSEDARSLEFLRPLGVGGFGAVYLANLHGRDRFVRRVAVKVMREGLESTPELVARQKDEARLLGLLAHEGIVQVLELAELEGRPAVIMEYVEGVDLAEIVKRIGPRPLPVRAALELVAAVSSALDAAYNTASALTGHPLRVIHRDIKPANVLLTASGRVKVLDFGVARADFARDGRTTNMEWGTPRFMSPEQWLGEPYGSAIDIYALGVTLFDLVASRPWERPPLTRTPYEAHVAALLDGERDLPEPLLALLAAMTAFDARDRPSAAEVRERAETLLVDAPGDSLARYARHAVPPLLAAREERLGQEPVPRPMELGGARRGEPTLAPEPDPSARTPAPAPTSQTPVRPGVPSKADAPTAPAPSRTPKTPLLIGVGIGLALVLGMAGAAVAYLRAEAPSSPLTSAAAPSPQPTAASAPAVDEAAITPPPAPGQGVATPSPMNPAAMPANEPPLTPPSRGSGPRLARGAGVPSEAPAAVSAARPDAARVSAPPAAAATVPVNIASVPASAQVWIDGQLVGETPLVSHALAPGTHRVQVRLEGIDSETKTFSLTGDAPLRLRFDYADQTWRTLK